MRILTAITCLVLANVIAYPQDIPQPGYTDFLPPSPTASELGKYGLVPVGLATGTPNISIPLHTYNTKNLSVPISLSYNSNGIKVDQIASWVGLGWSLNAGGVITRTVRDEPDDRAYTRDYPDEINISDAETLEYIETAAENVYGFDTEQDLYAFNFLGYSGKFMFDRDNTYMIMPHQNFKIQRVFIPSESGTGYFIVTTPDGIKYSFGQGNATETSRSWTVGTGCGKTFDLPKETAWYLTKIEHPLGEVIHLEYNTQTLDYYAGISQTATRILNLPSNQCSDPCPVPNSFVQTCSKLITTKVAHLSRIWSENNGEILLKSISRLDLSDSGLGQIEIAHESGDKSKYVFSYIFSNSGSNFSNATTTDILKHRMFLSSVTEYDSSLVMQGKKYIFEYEDINGLPPRLSYAQDHWGFFNGQGNNYLLPTEMDIEDWAGRKVFDGITGNRGPNHDYAKKGLLTKITYPTGGQTIINYEPNTYHGSKKIFQEPEAFTLGVTAPSNGIHAREVVKKELFINYGQEIHLSLNAQLSGRMLDPTHDKVNLTIYAVGSKRTVFDQSLTPNDQQYYYVNLLADEVYRIALTASGSDVVGSVSYNYIAEKPKQTTANIVTGGMRVASTTNFDPLTSINTTNSYFYSNPGTSNSSGKVGNAPVYFNRSIAMNPCGNGIPCETTRCDYGSLYSNSLANLYNGVGSNVFYQFVSVANNNSYLNGLEEHEFIINFDTPGRIIYGNHIKDAPYNINGWSNGLEKRKSSYKTNDVGDLILIQEDVNEYVADPRIANNIPALVVKKNMNLIVQKHLFITVLPRM